MIELLILLTVASILLGLSLPVSASVVDEGRTKLAASFLSSRFRLARIEAVNRGMTVGVVFDTAAGKWTLRVCRDDNGNGLKRAEIASGTDTCFDGPHDFEALFPGTSVWVDPRLIGPAGEPGNPDPVRFGTADIASFSPLGGGTAGSLFLRSARGLTYSVRLASNGRVRIFRYDVRPASWHQL